MVIGRWDLLVNARLRKLVLFYKDFMFVEIVEDAHHAASIPVVRHTTTIVNMAGRVHQHLLTENNTYNIKSSIPNSKLFPVCGTKGNQVGPKL